MSEPLYQVILDERERGLWDVLAPLALAMKSFSLSKQLLSIGDIVIQRQGDTQPLLLMERKSTADLLASIVDGRYKEQSARLLNASGLDPHNIIYLIEGPIGSLPEAQRQKVYSAMTSILVGKHMSVLRTWSLQETAELIARMTDKMARGVEGMVGIVVPTTLTAVRKHNITAQNIGEILLVQIPGISNVSARAILETYEGSFSKVLRAVETGDPVLEKIQYQAADGKMRRISKGIVGKLRELLAPMPAVA